MGAPDYKNAPKDMTIGQYEAEWAERKRINDMATREREKAMLSFESYLTEEGFISPWNTTDQEWEYILDWGHNHGLGIDYSQNEKDLPGPLKRSERY